MVCASELVVGYSGPLEPPCSTAPDLGCDHDKEAIRSAPRDFLTLSSQEGLVDLDLPREPLPVRAYHGPTQFVQPGPRGLMTSQTQNPLQP